MSIRPLITFKAGQCEAPSSSSAPYKVKPEAEPGYIYLYSEDDLVHFCWRKRSSPLEEPELDLVMVPTDGSFIPYENKSEPTAKTNGRIWVLKFASSSQRHFFWMQSKPQSTSGDPSWFSPRDLKIGEVVHNILQGEEVDVKEEMERFQGGDDQQDDDDDATMEDAAEGRRDSQGRTGGSGGAGPDATGGDVREEGEGSREGGADGARAASGTTREASEAVRNFLQSLGGGQSGQGAQGQQSADKPFPYLNHLLPTSITVPLIDSASEEYMDSLLSYLPQSVIVLASGSSEFDGVSEPSAAAVEAAKASLSVEDKRSLLKKVMRSPQFSQALATLTSALRDGGLPSIADALGVQVANGGYFQGGGMPLGGGQAVEAFVEGVKKTVQAKRP
ncbi:proteasome complex subunit rpn13 ubiquitin receptor domain-containing protein [Sarocladium implicatum]|nr:proteasome complex subunit rpn13 ubiquitin receptor domain-containing protein [Sarocladium implicatum]